MKKEKRILYPVAALLLGGLALIALATDGTDTISEAYKQFFGLTSTNTVLDLDSDSLNNLQESVLWTDPFIADTCANDQIMRPIFAENRVTHHNWVSNWKPGRSVTYDKQNERRTPAGVEAQTVPG